MHDTNLLGIGEVDERSDVQAADRAVPVEAGSQPVTAEDLLEAFGVAGEVNRIHGGVLNERMRAAGADACGHEQAETGIANPDQAILVGSGLSPQRVVSVSTAAPSLLESIQALQHLQTRVSREGHEQQRLRITDKDLGKAAEGSFLRGQSQDGAVEQLDGGGVTGKRVLCRRDRCLDRHEVADCDGLVRRGRNQSYGGLCDNCECALRADDEAREVERPVAGEAVEV